MKHGLAGRRTIVFGWLAAITTAVVFLGPALGPGALINLDLLLFPRLDLPSGFWGLGPELPRRLPLWVPISAISGIVPATFVGKLLLVASIAVAAVGMARLTSLVGRDERTGWVPDATVQIGAAALYALSPFVLTRLAVGHLNVTIPHAVAPWVLPILARPGRRLGATYLAAFALGFAGHFGGSIAMLVVVAAIVAGARERWWQAVLVTLAAQVSWLVPGALVAATNDFRIAGSDRFPTATGGVGDLVRLSAGGGFWNSYFQVGGRGVVASLVGALLVALACYGTTLLRRDRSLLVVLGVVGWVGVVASSVPIASDVFELVNDRALGGIWRESHRLLTLHLVWLAPAAALGGRRLAVLARSNARLRPASGAFGTLAIAAAITLAAPGLWGLDGQLAAERIPAGWHEARSVVRRDPGTVLALPWYQYFDVELATGPPRRVLNPMPLYLGGDVLSSSDNGLAEGVREMADPREAHATALVEELERGGRIGDDLGELGVRWVVVVTTGHIERYRALWSDPTLVAAVESEELTLFEVVEWVGPAVDARGRVDVDDLTPAIVRVDTDRDAVVSMPGAGGWRRGARAATTTEDGRLQVPPGTGPLWNVATVPALAAQLGGFAVAAVLGWRVVDRRRRRTSSLDRGPIRP